MPQRFAQALQHIAALTPDLLVISGDLMDYPFDAFDDPATQEQARQDLALIADLLADLPDAAGPCPRQPRPPCAVPRSLRACPSGPDRGRVIRILAFADDEGRSHVPLRVGDSQARFQAALADATSLPQVHVQHYLVWPERNEDYPHTYGDGAAMRDAILAAGPCAWS